jgi:hypothetical protein
MMHILLAIIIVALLIISFPVIDRFFAKKITISGNIKSKHVEKSQASMYCHSAGQSYDHDVQRYFITIDESGNTKINEVNLDEYNKALVGQAMKTVYQYGLLTHKLIKTVFSF